MPNAPSAVWARDTPSPTFRMATPRPLICDVNLVEIASPAASSFELLIRSPEDSLLNACWLADCDLSKFRCAVSEAILVLMICGIAKTPC